MNNIKYFLQYLIIISLFFIYKVLGLKYSSILSGKIFLIFGRFFRSNSISLQNLSKALSNSNITSKKEIINKMWYNYGQIFAEYMFLKDFKNHSQISKKIIIENQEVLEKIKKNSEPVIFISGHFNNFELMAMHIEKSGIDLAALYRPLNNKYLNPIMENIRKNYICEKQVEKSISGTKKLLKYFKNGTSIALMIDQRVSQGIKCDFFNEKALTTTIPAQFVKKFNAKIVPLYIQRLKDNNFKIKIHEPLTFEMNDSVKKITIKLNKILEKMILINPDQWIWTHNRWK
jgi:KDO2-lipid IV(A) lauroyltransferase